MDSEDLVVPVSAPDHVLGETYAPVTLVEYGDFECPTCKQAAPAVKLLLTRFAGRARLVYRHFPLQEVHPHALHAALAAEAAGGEAGRWARDEVPVLKTQALKLDTAR